MAMDTPQIVGIADVFCAMTRPRPHRMPVLPHESDILHLGFWQRAFETLRDSGAIRLEDEGKNSGCWVMSLASSPEFAEMDDPDKILVRSNGTVTYTGKDIAYQLWKLGLLLDDAGGRHDFGYRPFATWEQPGPAQPVVYDSGPHAIFSHPQVASVGLTERTARKRGLDYVTATRKYADTAYGWASEDTDSFVKVVANPTSRQLLGAHIIGPQASLLIQPLVQGMKYGQTVDEMAQVIYIHPALTEVVEQALLAL